MSTTGIDLFISTFKLGHVQNDGPAIRGVAGPKAGDYLSITKCNSNKAILRLLRIHDCCGLHLHNLYGWLNVVMKYEDGVLLGEVTDEIQVSIGVNYMDHHGYPEIYFELNDISESDVLGPGGSCSATGKPPPDYP